MAAGRAFIKGDTNTNQGYYHLINDASVSVTHTNTGVNHVDRLVLRVYDNIEIGGGQDKGTVEIVQGSNDATATLVNLNGAAVVPDTALLIANVLVSSGGSITFEDKRSKIFVGGILDDAVTTIKLADGAVTEPKAADGLFAPVGAMMPYGGTTAPTNWLLCQGQTVPQATYPALYALLGTAYGSDAGGNFTLPDLRDRVPVGASGTIARGATGGAKTHTLATTEIPAHAHPINPVYIKLQAGGGAGLAVGGTEGSSNNTTQNAGGGGSHNNMQPYQGVNYIIRAL